jgi:hypothetical protein
MGKLLWSNVTAEGGVDAHPYRGSENTNVFTGLAIFWLTDPFPGLFNMLPNFLQFFINVLEEHAVTVIRIGECKATDVRNQPFNEATALLRVHRRESRIVRKNSLCQGFRMIFSWKKKMEPLGLGKGWPISGFLQTRSEK